MRGGACLPVKRDPVATAPIESGEGCGIEHGKPWQEDDVRIKPQRSSSASFFVVGRRGSVSKSTGVDLLCSNPPARIFAQIRRIESEPKSDASDIRPNPTDRIFAQIRRIGYEVKSNGLGCARISAPSDLGEYPIHRIWANIRSVGSELIFDEREVPGEFQSCVETPHERNL